MHARFLANLRQNPADVGAWLAYADWLEGAGDRTALFVRFSLQMTLGELSDMDAAEVMREYDLQWKNAHAETRDVLALWRESLPGRFRVIESYLIGDNPPVEQGSRPRTVVMGFLEAGRVKMGTALQISQGIQRTAIGFDAFGFRNLETIAAGRAPITVAMLVAWQHLQIPGGSVLLEIVDANRG